MEPTNELLLPLLLRTATVNSPNQTNEGARGVHVIVDVTAIANTPSITVVIQGYDAASGKYYALLTAAAIVSVSTVVLQLVPGITESANLKVSNVLPRTWRVAVTHGDTDDITYLVSANLVL